MHRLRPARFRTYHESKQVPALALSLIEGVRYRAAQMQHLAGVMFFKGLILALALAFGGWWTAFRKRRAQNGLPLRRNRITGVYEVKDWTATVERGAIGIWEGVIWFTVAFNLTIWFCWWYFGRERLAEFVNWVLRL